MKSRRENRGDPPNYFDNLVWPAYLDAHRGQFVGGDVNGEAVKVSSDGDGNNDSPSTVEFGRPIANLVVLPADIASLEEVVEISCNELRAFIREIIKSLSRPVADFTTIHYGFTMDHFWSLCGGGGSGGWSSTGTMGATFH
jgi:hypothetical protein